MTAQDSEVTLKGEDLLPPASAPERARAAFRRPAATRAAVVLAGIVPVALGVLHGGYFPSTWLAFAVAAAAVVAALRIGAGPRHAAFRPTLPASAQAAFVFAGLFVGWNLLSAVWALDGAAALLEGTRAAVYLLALAATVAIARDGQDTRLLLSTLALGTAAVALGTIMAAASSASPESYFRYFKLNEPVGYYNAQATFFLVPALLAVHLSSRKSTGRLLRPLLFAAGVVALEAAVLTQSRGGFWAFVAGLVVYFALVPGRPRALLWWGAALAITVVAFPRLNAPHLDLRAGDLAALEQSVRGAAAAVSLSIGAALALSGALVVADTRVSFGRRATGAARVAAVLVVLVGLALLVVRFPALTDPVDAAGTAWEQFKGSKHTVSEVRILDLSGSHRYELWQVAWRSFEGSPLSGVGADNYVVEWNRERPITHDVKQPHNLYLRLLAELGVPGAALFAATVITALVAGLVAARRRSDHDRVMFACLAGGAAVFLVHAAAEWVWHMPAVGVTFFSLLGLLLVVGRQVDPGLEEELRDYGEGDDGRDRRKDPARPGAPRGRSAVAPLTAAALVSGVVVALAVPQLLSVRLDERAATLLAQGRPELAKTAATWARRTNPFSPEPHIILAKAAAAGGDVAEAEREFAEAARKDRGDWHIHLLWGDTLREAGADGTEAYRTAAELNPLSFDVRARLGSDAP